MEITREQELTREQFSEKINSLNKKGKTFNVESTDTGSVYLFLNGCNISVKLEEVVCGEITMYKPHTEMEVTIDFDLVDWLEENEDGSVRLELNSGLSDVVIRPVE